MPKTYTREKQQQGLRRLYLAVGAVMGSTLGLALGVQTVMGTVPNCLM